MSTPQRFFPSFRYKDAHGAIDFLERAFGFERGHVYEAEGGVVEHAQLHFHGQVVMLGSDRDDAYSGRVGQGWAYVVVDDPDALFARATDAGAEVDRPLTDQEYGSREFAVRDPEGNVWSFGTYRPDPDPPAPGEAG